MAGLHWQSRCKNIFGRGGGGAIREQSRNGSPVTRARRALVLKCNYGFVGIRVLLLCVFMTSVEANQELRQEDARNILLEVRKKVTLTLERLPRYLCTETIDRSTFRAEANRPPSSCDDLAEQRKAADWKVRQGSSDRLRLDVAVSSAGEMYSWVGEHRFDDRSLADLVGHGATLSGTFSGFLTALFVSDAASFTFNGYVTARRGTLVEFGYHVPLAKSHYLVGDKLHRANVEYEGTLWVDPKTYELSRLIIRTALLPPEVGACEASTTVDYERTRINNSEFLLATEARLHIIKSDGSEFEDRIVFSRCHEFLGDSVLRFDVPSEATQIVAPAVSIESRPLPFGLPLTVVLTESIDSATAAAGDRIKGALKKAITDASKGVLIPKDAPVIARIVLIERDYGPGPQSLTLGIKLETVEAYDVSRPLYASLEPSVRNSHGHVKHGDRVASSRYLGSFDQMEESGVALVRIEGVSNGYVIPRGLELTGITTTPDDRSVPEKTK
jgi:hypothetical protein